MFLVHRVPYPPNRGDRIRTFHLLKFLAQHARVSLATLADEPLDPGTVETLGTWCEQIAVERLGRSRWLRAAVSLAGGKSATEGLFFSRQLRQTIANWSRKTRWDAVVATCSSMVQYLELPRLRDVPTIVDLIDVDSQKFFEYASHARGLKRQLYRLEGRRTRRVEALLPDRVQAVTLVSEAEAELYRSFCPNDRTHVVTNGVDLDYYQPSASDGRPGRCIFVGAMDYQPNIEGVTWFVQHVWAEFHASRPDATFAIVGRNPVPAVRRLAEVRGVEVIGSVPDVRPHIDGAEIAVMPLQIARGVQNKVLEAMAMAKPVIASPQALEGLALEHGVHAAVAATPSEWLERLESLMSQAAARRDFGAAGRAFVERHHCWQACLKPLEFCLGLATDNLAAAAA